MHVSVRLVLLFGRFLHEIFAHVIIIGEGEGEGVLHELVWMWGLQMVTICPTTTLHIQIIDLTTVYRMYQQHIE